MKFGAHIYVWTDRFDDDVLGRLLDEATGLGLSFIEVPIGDDVCFDACTLRKRSADTGLGVVLSPGGLWPMECDISLAEPAARKGGIAWHKRAIELCRECGAVAYTGAIYGHPGHVSDHPPTPAEFERIADGVRELAEFAQGLGVLLALEPMSHFRTSIANTPRQVNELIGRAGSANVSSLLDTYHMCTEVTDFADAVRQMLPRLWGLHACENNRGVPGSGILPWRDIVAELARAGWDGYIGFESYNSTCQEGRFAWGRGMFHNVCPDGTVFVRSAKAFIETLFAEASRTLASGRGVDALHLPGVK